MLQNVVEFGRIFQHDGDYNWILCPAVVTGAKFLDKFGDCQFLKEDFASWS